MAYTPHVWIPRIGSNLNRFTKANETATSVDLTNAPEIVTQAGTPFSTDIMNEMEEGITDANAGIGLLATCDTAAATQLKEIDMSDYTIQAGMHIDIDFTYGNTVGSVEDGGIASGANIVTKGAGEQIRIVGKNGTFLFNEKIGGEYAGSGCHNAGDCHEMVITTMATGNTADTAGIIKNKDADDIYNVVFNVGGENYSYRKQRDGLIEQRIISTVSGSISAYGAATLSYTVPLSINTIRSIVVYAQGHRDIHATIPDISLGTVVMSSTSNNTETYRGFSVCIEGD